MRAYSGRPMREKWFMEARYGGLEVSELRRLRELEDENSRLKRLFGDLRWTTGRSRSWSEKMS